MSYVKTHCHMFIWICPIHCPDGAIIKCTLERKSALWKGSGCLKTSAYHYRVQLLCEVLFSFVDYSKS